MEPAGLAFWHCISQHKAAYSAVRVGSRPGRTRSLGGRPVRPRTVPSRFSALPVLGAAQLLFSLPSVKMRSEWRPQQHQSHRVPRRVAVQGLGLDQALQSQAFRPKIERASLDHTTVESAMTHVASARAGSFAA